MKRKPGFLQKVTDFIGGKGFYLVVLVCVAAIGLSGYYLVRSVLPDREPVEAVGEAQLPASAPIRPSAPVLPSQNPSQAPSQAHSAAPSQVLSQAPSQPPQPTETAQQPPAQHSAKPAALVFTWPVKGSILTPFSVETLLYDETMMDWRVHEGIDLAASIGTRVIAAAAGTVTDISEDDLMGVTVRIDHGDGLESVYSNLAAGPNIEVGERVYTGDVIGAVGNTAAAEIGRDPHLHFAMYQDQFPVSPENYLPKR